MKDVHTGTLSGISGHHAWVQLNQLVTLPIGTKVDLIIHEERRSKNANAYFHKLVGLIADELKESKHYIKNKLVAEYGQMTFYNGKVATFTSIIPPEVVHYWVQEHQHLWLTKTTIMDNETWYSYRVYKKTSEMTTREFSILLDGTIRECEQMGIPTMSQEELERFDDYERQN